MPRKEDHSAVAGQVDWAPLRLRELRESAGFSRDSVSTALDVNVKRLADIERGRYTLRWSTICRYLQVIGVPVDQWIVGCPGSYDRKKLPPALAKGQEVSYLTAQMKRLEDDQLKEIESWVKAERKSRKVA